MSEKHRVIFCGGRNRNPSREEVEWILGWYGESYITVVHGGARGVDSIVGEVAKDLGYEVEEYPAQWNKHGRSAGYKRNQMMAELPGVVEVVAFDGGKGTEHMKHIAMDKGIRVVLADEWLRWAKSRAEKAR